jgi:hypothetical protein
MTSKRPPSEVRAGLGHALSHEVAWKPHTLHEAQRPMLLLAAIFFRGAERSSIDPMIGKEFSHRGGVNCFNLCIEIGLADR